MTDFSMLDAGTPNRKQRNNLLVDWIKMDTYLFWILISFIISCQINTLASS